MSAKTKLLFNIDKNRRTGFTLVETIIYAALIGLVLTSFVSFTLMIVGIKNKNYAVAEVNNSADAIMFLLNNEIKTAGEIISPTPGNVADVLIIKQADGATTTWFADAGRFYKQNNESDPELVINGRAEVTNLNFANLAAPGTAGNIRFSLRLDYVGNKEFSYGDDFITAAAVRQQ